MPPVQNGELDIVCLYATFWRMLSLAVHRYGSAPTGEFLVVITLLILDRYDYQPTVTELADITQLPKSSISRYVSSQMTAGMLEEFIDPGDRRRRRLRPTAAAREEQQWHAKAVTAIQGQMRDVGAAEEARQSSGTELVRLLKRLNKELQPNAPAGGKRA